MFSSAIYTMDVAISVSMSGGNHSASGARLYADAIRVIECATVNDGHHRNQRAEFPERDDQAKQEQQVVRAIEDVKEAQLDELPRGLEPPGIEVHQARIAEKFKSADGSAWRQETQRDNHARRQPAESRMN